ncbi:PIN domain-containing protein [Thermococcus sp.]
MGMLSEIITKPELQILVNLLPEIQVGYPLYEIPLIRARATEKGYIVEAMACRGDFARAMSHHDLPDYGDFYECFISSGILKYDNIDEFRKSLELYEYLRKGVVFAPDTNIFYHRFISNFRPLEGYQIAVAEGVQREIENAMNYKYHHRELEEIKREVRNGSLLREFNNRRMKKSRKAAYIALKEFERLKDRIIIAESVSEDAHNNDEIIVKSLKRFDRMTPSLVVFLTADIAITDVAEIEGLEYFLFEYPTGKLGKHDVTAYQLRTLIFNLAAVFGVIEVSGVLVYGEFGGKRGLNELKLIFPRESRIYNEFEFHLKLSRRLMEIMGG